MLNQAQIIGRLGKDPEVRQTQSGKDVATLSVATSYRSKNQQGEWEEKTDWHRVVAFGSNATNAAKYLSKGRQVYISGRISTRKYTTDSGDEKYVTEIIANDLKFLGSKGDSQGGGGGQRSNNGGGGYQGGNAYNGGGGGYQTDDSVPF